MNRSSLVRSEQGSSLVITIMLLLVVSGLVAAIIASSMTDTLVSRNHHSGAQAQAAAEAGLNHAIDAARVYLRNWESSFSNTNEAVSRLLRGPDDQVGTTTFDADNGSLSWIPNGTPTPPTTLTLAGLNNVRYEARLFDDDDDALQNGWTAIDLGRPKVMEGYVDIATGARIADPFTDQNGIFVVRATGYAQDNTAVTVEAVMKPCPWPAIVTNANLDLAGSPQILGDGGSIHANGTITEVGVGATVQGDVTAVGTITSNPNWHPVTGLIESGQLPIAVPAVNVADYLMYAQYKLGNDGVISKLVTGSWTPVCASDAACGAIGFSWTSQASSKVSHMPGIVRTWDPGNANAVDCTKLTAAGIPNCGQGVYHAELSDVKITGNIGRTGTPSPYALTLLVDGSVEISGTPHLVPALDPPNILIVTNGDVDMTGTANCIIAGQVRLREQFNMAGNMSLTGQVIIESRWDISDKVTGDSKVSGNATVTNDRLAVYDFSVAGWREFRR